MTRLKSLPNISPMFKPALINPKNKQFQNQDPLALAKLESPTRVLKILRAVAHPHKFRRPKTKLTQIETQWDQLLVTNNNEDVFSWLGHSSVAFKLSGVSVLIDPVFTSASPFKYAVRRFQPSPLNYKNIHTLDLLILSHDHYDHLDARALKHLGTIASRIVVPLGVKKNLISLNIEDNKITEHNWGDQVIFKELTLTCCPAQHFSGRGLFDRNRSLWCSWLIESPLTNIYFSGDSGYAPHFKEIGKLFNKIDLAFMENGQYHRLWKSVHMLPEESVQACLDLGAKTMIPIHWAAYSLSPHAWYDPGERVYHSAQQAHLDLILPVMGQIVYFSQLKQTTELRKPWWNHKL